MVEETDPLLEDAAMILHLVEGMILHRVEETTLLPVVVDPCRLVVNDLALPVTTGINSSQILCCF